MTTNKPEVERYECDADALNAATQPAEQQPAPDVEALEMRVDMLEMEMDAFGEESVIDSPLDALDAYRKQGGEV